MDDPCELCGEYESDGAICGECGRSVCDDCCEWCCDPDDELDGEYFCLDCIAEANEIEVNE